MLTLSINHVFVLSFRSQTTIATTAVDLPFCGGSNGQPIVVSLNMFKCRHSGLVSAMLNHHVGIPPPTDERVLLEHEQIKISFVSLCLILSHQYRQ